MYSIYRNCIQCILYTCIMYICTVYNVNIYNGICTIYICNIYICTSLLDNEDKYCMVMLYYFVVNVI